MRKFLILVGGLLIMLLAACGGDVKAEAPRIGLEMTMLELGEMPNGEIAERDVKVSNEGREPLVVKSVVTTCGCTTAVLTPMTIAPGETGTLHIAFDSGAHGPDLRGEIMRRVILTTNDPAQPEMFVDLEATITDPAVN